MLNVNVFKYIYAESPSCFGQNNVLFESLHAFKGYKGSMWTVMPHFTPGINIHFYIQSQVITGDALLSGIDDNCKQSLEKYVHISCELGQ